MALNSEQPRFRSKKKKKKDRVGWPSIVIFQALVPIFTTIGTINGKIALVLTFVEVRQAEK